MMLLLFFISEAVIISYIIMAITIFIIDIFLDIKYDFEKYGQIKDIKLDEIIIADLKDALLWPRKFFEK